MHNDILEHVIQTPNNPIPVCCSVAGAVLVERIKDYLV